MDIRAGFERSSCRRALLITTVALIVPAPHVAASTGNQSARAAPAEKWSAPPVLHFCAAHCATLYLTRDGSGYTGTRGGPSPRPYGVKIVTFNPDAVVLDRIDPPNQWFPHGLKATISGHVAPDGGSLKDGKIHWTFGQPGTYDARVTWGHALDSIPGDDNFLPPVVLHFCAAHCATWFLTLDHKGYTGTPKTPAIGPDGYGVKIVRFAHDGVELDRSDPPNQWFAHGLKAVITGQVSPAGSGLVNGKIRWTFGQSGTHDVRMSWGTGLNDIPGQDGPAVGPQSQQLLAELMILFLASSLFDDDSSSSSSPTPPVYRNPCAGVYSAACGTERRHEPR